MKTLRDYIDLINRPLLTESIAKSTQVTLLEAHEFVRQSTPEVQAVVRALISEGRTHDAVRVMRHINGIELDEGVGKWIRNAAAAGAIGLAGLGAMPHAQAAEPVQQPQAAVQQADSASTITQQLMALGSGADFQKWMGANMNLPEIAHQIAGEKWNQATPEQKAELTKAVQQLFVNKYGSKIGFLKGKTFDLKASPDVGGKAQVAGQLKGSWIGDIDLGFKMEKVGGQWKVDDVVARGNSIVDGIKNSVGNAPDVATLIQKIQQAA